MVHTRYIHPDSDEITALAETLQKSAGSAEQFIQRLLAWFDENIAYSRLSAPLFPLQRSDLDVLKLRSGTCGDFANLVVSLLQNRGFTAGYAWLTRDYYGDPQDHICAAVWMDGEWALVDAALPYRKWKGFRCPHREYALLTPEEFALKIQREEEFWRDQARSMGEERLAGLLYAPWLHEEVLLEGEDALTTAFYLLEIDKYRNFRVSVSLLFYTPDRAKSLIQCTCCGEERSYRFSICPAEHIWDESQWSESYSEHRIPAAFHTDQLAALNSSMEKYLHSIYAILQDAGCRI